MTIRVKKVNKKLLREACEKHGVRSFSALARQLGCARVNIYMALERPSRLSRVYAKLVDFCE
jgi:hypothetical protein